MAFLPLTSKIKTISIFFLLCNLLWANKYQFRLLNKAISEKPLSKLYETLAFGSSQIVMSNHPSPLLASCSLRLSSLCCKPKSSGSPLLFQPKRTRCLDAWWCGCVDLSKTLHHSTTRSMELWLSLSWMWWLFLPWLSHRKSDKKCDKPPYSVLVLCLSASFEDMDKGKDGISSSLQQDDTQGENELPDYGCPAQSQPLSAPGNLKAKNKYEWGNCSNIANPQQSLDHVEFGNDNFSLEMNLAELKASDYILNTTLPAETILPTFAMVEMLQQRSNVQFFSPENEAFNTDDQEQGDDMVVDYPNNEGATDQLNHEHDDEEDYFEEEEEEPYEDEEPYKDEDDQPNEETEIMIDDDETKIQDNSPSHPTASELIITPTSDNVELKINTTIANKDTFQVEQNDMTTTSSNKRKNEECIQDTASSGLQGIKKPRK